MAKSIESIKEDALKSAFSRYWFSDATLKAFNSIVYAETFDGGDGVTLFITSEADKRGRPGMRAYDGKRRFAVRYARANGEIANLSGVMAFSTKARALKVASQVAQWWRTDTGPQDMGGIDLWVTGQEN